MIIEPNNRTGPMHGITRPQSWSVYLDDDELARHTIFRTLDGQFSPPSRQRYLGLIDHRGRVIQRRVENRRHQAYAVAERFLSEAVHRLRTANAFDDESRTDRPRLLTNLRREVTRLQKSAERTWRPSAWLALADGLDVLADMLEEERRYASAGVARHKAVRIRGARTTAHRVRVMFRADPTDRDGEETFAMFLDEPADHGEVAVYDVNGHSSADPRRLLEWSVVATPRQHRWILQLLGQKGYEVEIVTRFTPVDRRRFGLSPRAR